MPTVLLEEDEREFWGVAAKKPTPMNPGDYRKGLARQRKPKKPKRKEKAKERRRSYPAYISSPEWTARRKRYFQEHGKFCAVCGYSKVVTLHHMSYEHLGNERDSELVGLCHDHHHHFHELNGSKMNMIAETKAYIAQQRAILGLSDTHH